MNRIIFLFLTVLGLGSQVQAQSVNVKQSVLNACGRTVNLPSGSPFPILEYSVGEVATVTLTNLINGPVTQGVLQPTLGTVNTNEAFDEKYTFRSYPNPTSSAVMIETDYQHFELFQIIDLSGRIIVENTFGYAPINCESISAGTYVVRLYSINQPESKTFKIIKQ